MGESRSRAATGRLIARAAAGDAASMDVLVREHLDRMMVVAKRGCRGFGDGQEYLGVCAEFFMRRVARYSARRGASLWTYASRGMLGEVKRVCYSTTGAIYVPRVPDHASALTRERAVAAKHCWSTDQRFGYTGYDGQGVGCDSDRVNLMNEPSVNGEARHRADDLEWVRRKMMGMTRTERVVLSMSMDGMTMREIGRAIGVGESRVSQLLLSLVKRLKERAITDGLAGVA